MKKIKMNDNKKRYVGLLLYISLITLLFSGCGGSGGGDSSSVNQLAIRE